MKRKITLKVVYAILVFALIANMLCFTINAVASSDEFAKATTQKTDFNYVSLGASNVNGYGLHGYNFDVVYEAPYQKHSDNLYGYKMDTPGSYPVLIKDKLSEKYNVNLSQMAISSMRAEELRFILDESYRGDGFTDVWFYDNNGDGFSLNYFYGAGALEWNERNEAAASSGKTPSIEEALASLRDEYRKVIREADLITIDVGMNNFGTYMGNPLENDLFTSDVSTIDPQLNEYYQMAKSFALGIIKDSVGDAELPEDMLNLFMDSIAYALIGYCINLDVALGKIYELNPDVDVVLVGVQNLTHGLEVSMEGSDENLPVADIWGLVVNAANLYTAVLSPYADRYYFADVCTEGRVEYFIDEYAAYNGNPSTITENMKDCFDVYETNFLLKTRVQQMFALYMNQMGLVNLTDLQKDAATTEGLDEFYYGLHSDLYPGKTTAITVSGGDTLKEFFKKGEAGKLDGEMQKHYDKYENMLTVAYDVFLEIVSETASNNIVAIEAMAAIATTGRYAYAAMFEALASAMEKVLTEENYSFDLDAEYPDGFFTTIASMYGISGEHLKSALLFILQMDVGGGLLSHPCEKGYEQLCDIIMNAYDKKITGKDVISDQMSLYYVPDGDSYYVAVSGGNAGYAPIFADSMGLGKNQVGYTSLDNLDYSKINKADLISIGFDEAGMLGFATDQIFAYIGNYISTYVRTTLNDYIVDVMGSIPLLSMFGFGAQASEMINSAIDDILAEDIFAGKTMVEMNWSELLEGDDLATIELLRGEMKNAVTDSMGEENYTITFDVVEMIAENADSFNLNGTAASLIKNKTLMYNLLDKNAYLNIEIPVSEGVAYAVEAHLYGYFDHMVKAEKLISYIHANNPKAQIVLMGSFNPIRNAYMDLGEGATNIGELYSFLTLSCNLPLLMQYSESHTNSTFIYAFDAKSIYDASVEAGEADGDFMTFLSEFATDRSILNYTAESNKYVAEQMLYYVRSSCENHKYSDACDTICNRCEAEREVPHRYSDCDDTICNNCGFEREALAHVYDGCDDTACDNCGKERKAISHVLDGCIGTYCSACGKTVDAIGHSFGEWTVTKKPGFLSKGEESRSCSACGYTEARAIDGSNNNEDSDVVGGSDSSNDGLVIVIILAVVVVGAAGFLVYWFVIRKKVVKAPEAEESAESESHKLENTKPTEESTDEVTSEKKAEDNESNNG